MARKCIALMGGPPVIEEEEKATAALTPGHLLMFTGTGTNAGVAKNTANNANVSRMFALERVELGKGIDDAYASGERVKIGHFWPGQRVYAFLASGQNVAKGDYLTGDNAGQLTAASSNPRLAQAVEAVDASAAAARIRVQIV